MRVLFFGTYDARRHPRVAVLAEGLGEAGMHVEEANAPVQVGTSARVAGVSRPWRLIRPGMRLAAALVTLWWRARRVRPPDAVVVGYLGIFDVHLARLLWRRTPIVLDQLAFAGDTARDRGVGGVRMLRLLDFLDRKAAAAADVVLVDTDENLALLPPDLRRLGLVVPVGAPRGWFRAPQRREGGPLRLVFFGLYTPLQGATVIGEAICVSGTDGIEWTMVGHGQDLESAHAAAGGAANVRWVDWVDAAALPDLVAGHDVCLGIFGSGDKALRVVPNKVYQGAAAGCAVVTSDTEPQRRTLGDDAVYVPAGDATALAEAVASLAADPERLWSLREAAYRRALHDFDPAVIVGPLRGRLDDLHEATGNR